MRRKAERADKMFESLVREMNEAVRVERPNIYQTKPEAPKWLSAIK